MRNETLEAFARSEILSGLNRLEEKNRTLFKRMYARGGDISIPIEDVVRDMPMAKLDTALSQVERTLEKIAQRCADEKAMSDG